MRGIDQVSDSSWRHPVEEMEPDEECPEMIANHEGGRILLAFLQFIIPPQKGARKWDIARNRLAAIAHKVLPEVAESSQAAVARELGITRSGFCELDRLVEGFANIVSPFHQTAEQRLKAAETQRQAWVTSRRARRNESQPGTKPRTRKRKNIIPISPNKPIQLDLFQQVA